MNGITEINGIENGFVTRNDLVSCLLDIAGARISNMPRNYQSKSYSDKFEIFDPEKVENSDLLPDYWKMVFEMHNKPDMGDCRSLRYMYVHTPVDVIPRYPRVPCKGIFQIDRDRAIDISKIKETDLVHIGNEFDD